MTPRRNLSPRNRPEIGADMRFYLITGAVVLVLAGASNLAFDAGFDGWDDDHRRGSHHRHR